MLSTPMIRLVPYAGQFMAITLGVAGSTFGIAIAKEDYRTGVSRISLR